MEGSFPIRPGGPLFTISCVPSAPNATAVPTPTGGDVDYNFYNSHASVDAVIGYGPTSSAAITNAVFPTIGGPSNGAVIVPHGLMKTYTLTPGLFFSGITQLGSCSVLCLPGYGT